MRSYIAILHKDSESDYGVCFPDFPGCISAGSTLEEARIMARDALIGHIAVREDYGDPTPEPMSLDEAMRHEFAEGAQAFFLVEVPWEDPIVRANITIPKGVLEEVDRYAKAHHLTRSAFLLQAARQAMQRGA